MTFLIKPLAAASLLLCIALPDLAAAADGVDFKFSGFGTLGAVHSSEKRADFVGSSYQPNGAGATQSTSFAPDSKLGAQLGAQFNDSLSAVVQVVSQHQYDNSYVPQIEWANLKYQIDPALSVRVGRIALPLYMASETRYVGFANPWVRAPEEVYRTVTATNNDGADASYRSQIAGANNTAQIYYGTSSNRRPEGIKVKTHPTWGLNDTVEIGALSVRAGYTSLDYDLVSHSLDGLFAVLPPATAQKYKLTGMALSLTSLGATYDPGDWFVMGEAIAFKGQGILSDARSWYGTAGYRLGNFTPYATYADLKTTVKPETDAGVPFNSIVNSILTGAAASQHSISVGLRWDFHKGLALKTQFDRWTATDNTHGRLINVQPGLPVNGTTNLASVALDFVY